MLVEDQIRGPGMHRVPLPLVANNIDAIVMDTSAYESRCPRPEASKPPKAEVMNHPVWVLGSDHLLSVFLTAQPSFQDLLFMVFARALRTLLDPSLAYSFITEIHRPSYVFRLPVPALT